MGSIVEMGLNIMKFEPQTSSSPRRFYDVVSIFSGVGMMERSRKGQKKFEWIGMNVVPDESLCGYDSLAGTAQLCLMALRNLRRTTNKGTR